MRERVRALKAAGRSNAEIGRLLGVNRSTIAYHARRLDIPPDPRFGRRFDWIEIRRAYESGMSMRQCQSEFGFSRNAWQDAVGRGDIVIRSHLIPIKDLLVVGRKTNRSHLKLRLLNKGLKEDRCEECGISDWFGLPLSVHLHHVNGDGADNRLENIQFLCPNCHSQTDTYGGRNGHRRTDRAA